MEKTLRCTQCTWRGPWDAAMHSAQVRPSDIPPASRQVQHDIEQRQFEQERLGAPHVPRCPVCGHHTVEVVRRSIRPAI